MTAYGYRCVYGENVEGALRLLFNAIAPKAEDSGLVLQGIPDALCLDNGPIAKSLVFRRVLDCLGVRFMPHLPQSKDGRRPTARSKGKSLPSGLTRGSSARSAPSKRRTRRCTTSAWSAPARPRSCATFRPISRARTRCSSPTPWVEPGG